MGTYDHAPHFALVAMSRLSIFEVQCCRILVGDGKKLSALFFLFFLSFVSYVCFKKKLNYLKYLYQSFVIRFNRSYLYGCKLIYSPPSQVCMVFNLTRTREIIYVDTKDPLASSQDMNIGKKFCLTSFGYVLSVSVTSGVSKHVSVRN